MNAFNDEKSTNIGSSISVCVTPASLYCFTIHDRSASCQRVYSEAKQDMTNMHNLHISDD